MTKLEELYDAYEAAEDVSDAAWDKLKAAAVLSVWNRAAGYDDAYAAYYEATADADAARAAYRCELKKVRGDE